MSSAAVMSPGSSRSTLARFDSSSRRKIVAGIDASAAAFGNHIHHDDSHAHPVPVSNTDALLRSRKPSDASSTAPSLARPAYYSRSQSASSISHPHTDPASASPGSSQCSASRPRNHSSSIRSSSPHGSVAEVVPAPAAASNKSSRGWGTGSIRIRRRSSNLSQQSSSHEVNTATSGDERSILSRKASKSSGFVGLLRRRSRAASSSTGETLVDSSTDLATPAPSRLRTYSGTSRSASLSPNARTRTGSIPSLNSARAGSAGSDQVSLPPPVPALPDALRASNGSIRSAPEGYKVVRSAGMDSQSYSASPRSRKYTRPQASAVSMASTAVQPVFLDPFAQADRALARAGSQSQGQGSDTLARRQGALGLSNGAAIEPDLRKAHPIPQNKDASAPVPARTIGAANARSAHPTGYPHADQDEEPASFDESSSEDEFYDAELANITEGSEEEEDDQEEKSNADQGRTELLRATSRSDMTTLVGASRSASPEPVIDNRRAKPAQASPHKLRGTAAASRRAGHTAAADDQQPATISADAKARGDLPSHVHEKAARVAQLGIDDVQLTPEELREDIEVARKALNLFLNSRMLEAEKIVSKHADTKLYYALGYAIIATIKGFMTFEPTDLASAISLCKDSLTIANLLRKPSSSVANFGRFVRGMGQSPSSLAGMNSVQKHAELVYAESLLLKAVLGIVYAGDFFAFVSEALNMRNAYGIYRSLSKYVEWADEKGATEQIDEDFRTGVYLGNGMISMILGLVPGKVLKIMEVFGYTGDTNWALKTLSRAGGWSADPNVQDPAVTERGEGVRRQICDMGLLMYHLVISTFIPVNGVDIAFADKVLHYNLKRYPEGVFFLYFSGRLYSTQALSERAVTQFETARDVQKEYVQLKHICVWDLALCHMSLCQWQSAYENFKIMAEENNWSKAVYNYGRAAMLYERARAGDNAGDDEAMQEAADLFQKIPNLTQRIAGKSIPMEKFVARKAKKFSTYKRLLLPGLEFSYVYHCLSNAPRFILAGEALVLVSDALAQLHEVGDPARYHSGEEYHDDLALTHFLRGVCLKFIAFPEKHSKVRPRESPVPIAEAARQAELSFKTVLDHGDKIKLDHWLVYFAHYELGRLYAGMGRTLEAKEQLNLVLSQKTLEDKGRKGKYSLQNMVQLRANGALNALDGK
ncbi:hypothetical protein ACQY0O_004433 [Thecaphora frezii]